MELVSIGRLQQGYLAQIAHATRRCDETRVRAAELLAGQIQFLDRSAERLAHAEQHGSYDRVRVVSESTAGRDVAALIRDCVDTLAQSTDGLETARCREYLHDVFALHGAEVFEAKIAYHVGKQRMLTVNGEWDAWRAQREAVS